MKHLKAFLIFSTFFTTSSFVNLGAYATNTPTPTINPDVASVSCSGSYINNQFDDSVPVRYVARWTPNIYEITLDLNLDGATAGNPTVLYNKYEHGWYTDETAETSFTQMVSIPFHSSYKFLGFWSCVADDCEKIIDEYGFLVPGASTTITTPLVAYWAYGCVATLHIGDDELCLYTEKVSDEGNPSLVIKASPTRKYYAAMSPVDGAAKPISSTSDKKLYIKYGTKIYNVHDKTIP